MTEFMRNSDAFTWAMESDPRLRSTVVTVIMLDRSPDWDEVRDRFDLISRAVPMLRQRVVPSPPPAPPRWEHAPDFDLDFHMRRVTAPAPGTVDTVLEMARVAAMEDFDRARPLWDGHAGRRTRKRRRSNGPQVSPCADRRRRRHPDRDDPLRSVRGPREARAGGGPARSAPAAVAERLPRHRAVRRPRGGQCADGHPEDGSKAGAPRAFCGRWTPFRRPRSWPRRSTGPCAR